VKNKSQRALRRTVKMKIVTNAPSDNENTIHLNLVYKDHFDRCVESRW
jgi:hypothetical protein